MITCVAPQQYTGAHRPVLGGAPALRVGAQVGVRAAQEGQAAGEASEGGAQAGVLLRVVHLQHVEEGPKGTGSVDS